VIDIGGGANPLLSAEFVRAHGLDYGLVDISQGELDKAPVHYTSKICVDMGASREEFGAALSGRTFDMAFSHMFLEHAQDPRQVHLNIGQSLRERGLAIHFYPSANNLPLALNRLLPESVSASLLRFAHPRRDLDGKQGKFPAYYRMCGNRSPSLHARFREFGYEVLIHTGFVGHNYYSRIRLLDKMEQSMRGPLIRMGIGLTTFQLLVLRKT
jgi:hypothetical protein